MKDAESVRNQQQQHLQQHSCTLDECFQLYTKEEQVGDASWTFMKRARWFSPSSVSAHFQWLSFPLRAKLTLASTCRCGLVLVLVLMVFP